MADSILFSAKWGNWIVIKKMAIDRDTRPAEVAGILAGIETTVNRKAFEFAGIKTAPIDELAAQLTKGKRRGWGTVAEIFGKLSSADLKSRLAPACPEGILLPIAEAYLLKRVLENIGMNPTLDLEELQYAYPQLKIQKPRGRLPGSKKKEKWTVTQTMSTP